ncbi:CsgG/HfaB family protein [Anaerovibrio sp.]|uniref:CsgG/HfaB family protein n=1 Tax=Anaerovibrio sp. TaxID=1872532 RepID=UPI0025C4AD3B|nr:CsgG/HfaB family protein [Anaerovibrio sp.]MBR2142285.1 hypothetical protein [Anaerovibrio sp.]
MRKGICMLIMLFCFVGTGKAASLHDYPNVAVLPYANKAAVSRQLSMEDASMVSEFVIEQLLDSERFNLIEREMLEAIMKEHSFNMSGIVDLTTAAQIGKLAGVKYLVAGSVTGLSTKSSGASYSDSAKGGAGFNINTVIANVTARFIDVETGRIVLAASGTGESASTNVEFSQRKTKKETLSEYYPYTESMNSGVYDSGIDGSGNVVNDEVIDDGEVAQNDDMYIATENNAAYDSSDMGTEAINIGSLASASKVVERERKIVIGTKSFSQVQVRNALYKAVGDLIYNKKFGILAKMDGKARRRKV